MQNQCSGFLNVTFLGPHLLVLLTHPLTPYDPPVTRSFVLRSLHSQGSPERLIKDTDTEWRKEKIAQMRT